jgi:hypothetical protein
VGGPGADESVVLDVMEAIEAGAPPQAIVL